MTHTSKIHCKTFSALLAAVLVSSSLIAHGTGAFAASAKTGRGVDASATESGNSAIKRTAHRLQKRVQAHYGVHVQIPQLVTALQESKRLFSKTLTVQFQGDDGTSFGPWTLPLQEHAYWVRADIGPAFSFAIDESRIRADLEAFPPDMLPVPAWSVLHSLHDDRGTLKAVAEGIARPGYVLDAAATAPAIAKAFGEPSDTLTLPVRFESSVITNVSGQDLGSLTLLGRGRSDFAGSGVGRKNNVRKGANVHLTNTVVPAGATFSFNGTMNNMTDAGWDLALGIFNGSELRPVRGGGICQVATTLYRSILQAGLPVTARANHSLFVHYYEKHGVGIDATIFPKQQDLAFLNDTGKPLLIQSYTEGDEAFVNIFGTPDGRTASLAGPYFSSNAPSTLRVSGRPLKANEIAWVQTVRFADGRETENLVYSRYKSLPRSFASTYIQTQGEIVAVR